MIEPVVPIPQVKTAGAGAEILLVEDNRTVGEVVSAMLEACGHSVAWAVDAESSLRLLDREGGRFDLAILDVVLPGMNGVALARLIRNQWPAVRVVLVSGYSDVLAGTEAAEFEVMHKPYSPERLAQVLNGTDKRIGW